MMSEHFEHFDEESLVDRAACLSQSQRVSKKLCSSPRCNTQLAPGSGSGAGSAARRSTEQQRAADER